MDAASRGQSVTDEAPHRFFLAMADPAYQWLSGPARWSLAIPAPFGAIWALSVPLWIIASRSLCPAFFHSVAAEIVFFVWFFSCLVLPLGPRLSGGPGVLRRALGRRLVERRAFGAAKDLDGHALETARDGAVVSATGRVRARRHLAHRVGGKACVGIAIGCRGAREEVQLDSRIPTGWGGRNAIVRTRSYPALYEMLHDFELETADGRLILVRGDRARLLGAPNVDYLGDDVDGHMLMASLELPLGAIASPREALVLRDGDLVSLVGFKSEVIDPDSPDGNARNPAIRLAIVSSSSMPALIVPAPRVFLRDD